MDLAEKAGVLLKRAYRGHPSFIDKLLKQVQLYSLKNQSYTVEGDPFGNFSRVAQLLAAYPSFPMTTSAGVAIVYLLKHLDKVLNDMSHGIPLSEENLNDIAVYINIINCMSQFFEETQRC